MELQTHQSSSALKRPLVDLEQLMGDWYVIAHIPTPTESKCTNAVESFHWNEKEQRIDVHYHFNDGAPDGPLKKMEQKAWISDENSNTEWDVQFVWPLKVPYRVLDVASDYCWAILGTTNENFVWVMSRKPHLDFETYQTVIRKIQAFGYDTSKLRKVPQIWDPVS